MIYFINIVMTKKILFLIILSFLIESFLIPPFVHDFQKLFTPLPLSKYLFQSLDAPLSLRITHSHLRFLPSSPPWALKNKTRNPENEDSFFVLSSFPQVPPSWWEIKLLINTTGEYIIKEGKKSYTGNYSFTLLWTGCMEEDMDDYIIYHENSNLLQWEAQEKALSPDFSGVVSADDFSGKPRFDFHYILRRREDLHFDFQVDGFYVPQNNSDFKFYLNLPASKEKTKSPSKFDYNTYVSQGSNSIYIQEEEIYLVTVEKTCLWKWKHQKRLSGEKTPVSLFNSHKVEVSVSIMPRF